MITRARFFCFGGDDPVLDGYRASVNFIYTPVFTFRVEKAFYLIFEFA